MANKARDNISITMSARSWTYIYTLVMSRVFDLLDLRDEGIDFDAEGHLELKEAIQKLLPILHLAVSSEEGYDFNTITKDIQKKAGIVIPENFEDAAHLIVVNLDDVNAIRELLNRMQQQTKGI